MPEEHEGLVRNQESGPNIVAVELGSIPRGGTNKIMEGYLGWAQHCLENRWIAKAVGVRFYQPSSSYVRD